MKQRFNSLDVRAMALEMQTQLFPIESMSPYRVQNIYQLTSKSFMLKLVRTHLDLISEEVFPLKRYLLLESGIRFHFTNYESGTKSFSVVPSPTLLKLRQFIKGKRIVSFSQLGDDRVVRFTFGSGATYECRLYLELYSSGNLIITNYEDVIISTLRIVENEKLSIKPSVVYSPYIHKLDFSEENFNPTIILGELKVSNFNAKKLATKCEYFRGSSILAQNAIDFYKSNQCNIQAIVDLLLKKDFHGYHLYNIGSSGEEHLVEFSPISLFVQQKRPFKYFDSFSSAVDLYFASIEKEILAEREKLLKSQAQDKKASVKNALDARIKELESLETQYLMCAHLIEENEELVDAAIWAVQSSLASGMTWDEVSSLVNKETKKGNSVAKTIKQLDFTRNTIYFQPPSSYNQFDQTESSSQDSCVSIHAHEISQLMVPLTLSLNARGNIQRCYQERRNFIHKKEKTLEAHKNALISAERKIEADLKEALQKLFKGTSFGIPIRTPFWFEKFSWFISSDHLLVIAGTNSQQNELLVKKYLGPKDIYLHAEIQGAPSVIIKYKDAGLINVDKSDLDGNQASVSSSPDCSEKWIPPPSTLSQAASMAVCLSSAWDCNVVTGAYWVFSEQVSKSPPTGLYLAPGSFMIYGKKNFLTPTPLIYGFGFIFKLGDDVSIERHKSEQIDNYSAYKLPYDSAAILDPEYLEKEAERISKFPTPFLQKPEKKKSELNIKKRPSKGTSLSEKKLPDSHNPTRPYSEHEVRGRKGKLEKIKKKYRDQDIEDTMARMQLMGVQDPLKNIQRIHSGKQMVQPEAKKLSIQQMDEEIIVADQGISPPNLDVEVDPEESSDEEELGSSQTQQSSDCSFLTGRPVSEDVLSFAIPMCGPWAALQSFSIRVKLTPGNLKKGKAVKTALPLCLMQTNSLEFKHKLTPLIKQVKDEQLINVMLHNCKVTGPAQALQKIHKMQKSEKKKRAKDTSKSC